MHQYCIFDKKSGAKPNVGPLSTVSLIEERGEFRGLKFPP